ncbi:hypothetical protein [Streptomyces sp. IBSBF 3136]|uniref:hypothetical protein n=1 Tax=Streptomyces sp. IBSBF 3136 TaxID=2903524 RepID=UPI002FDBF566
MSDGSHGVLNLSLTVAIGLPLAFLHVWSPYVHPGRYIDSRYWRAFADGISITYIFLQLLPEITRLADEELHADESYVLRFPGWLGALSAWGEQNPFLPLLLGFTLFYGLERGIERPVDHGSSGGAGRPVHFWVHMVGMSLYKILLGYLMGQITSVFGLLIFAFAITMHFLVIDFHLLEMHHSAYHRIGRWILTGAFLVGWFLSTQVAIDPPVLAMLVSFVAGGAVLMIIQDEFSESVDNSYAAFLIAVLLYGSLLLAL